MFYFCFHSNHSHNLMLKVYLVVSLVKSYVKMITSVKTLEIFCKKCSCTYLLKKRKVWDKKRFFPKKSKRGYT